MLCSCSAPVLDCLRPPVISSMSGGRRLNSSFGSHQLSRVRHGKVHLWTRRPLLRVSEEHKPVIAAMSINEQHVALVHLCSGQKTGNYADHIPLNSSLQVARPIPLVGSFLQQELTAFVRDSKYEGARC